MLGVASPGAPAAGDATRERTGDVLDAVVAVHANVPPSARTARTLGTERSGSGIVIDGNGLVVTVGYLVLEAASVELGIGERRIPARVLAYDHDTGLGLLRAEGRLDVGPVRLGDSTALAERAHLLVSSHGGVQATRPAVLVSRRAFAGYWEYLLEDALFTAPVHPMFGGAALLDDSGALVGIGSLTVSDAVRGRRPVPGNVFIPVDLLKRVLPDLLSEGRSSGPVRPWLGLYADDALGPVVVRRLAEGGPAAAAGIAVGDVVIGVGTEPATSLEGFYRALWASGTAGDAVKLTLLRAGRVVSVSVASGDRYDWLRAGAAAER
jgi:S1-C subfamily serine protease